LKAADKIGIIIFHTDRAAFFLDNLGSIKEILTKNPSFVTRIYKIRK
jgi:hypothetical protein